MGKQISGGATDSASRDEEIFFIVLMKKRDTQFLCRHMPWRIYEVLDFSMLSINWL